MNKPRTALHSDSSNDQGTERAEAFPPVYPLFADHDPPLPLGIIDYLVVQRVLDDSAVRPGADKRTRYKVWPERFDPLSTDEITIAEHCGGGMYDVRAVGAKGRTVAGCRLELEGAPREFVAVAQGAQSTGAESYGSPVQQAAPGVISVRGLDPNVQALLAMMQANNERAEKQLEAQRLAVREEAQRAREDARAMNETMVRMVEATVKGAAPPVPQDAQMMGRWIDRLERDREREIERFEKRLRKEERADSEGGGFSVERVVESVPALLSAMPAFQAKLAELVQPMLKESAKEIVSGVLNELAKTGGTG
ncbi:MAG: hypothetical protein Q8Q09_11135 [Deltaproteobacteria bacterium]|nr:hypothetical protein [Deltaproteobacteria bacterium]